MFFDTHAHVSLDQFDNDRSEVISRARAAGLQGWLEVGTDLAQSRLAVETANKETGVFATVGVHPSDIGDLTEATWQELSVLLAQDCVRAIGEVGLDYYRGGTKEQQLPILDRFRVLAQMSDLPMVFHIRDGENASAHEDVLEWLEALPTESMPRGVMHTFSGTAAQAERYLALGLYLSFSGVVTFKNAGDVSVVASSAPLDRILIETDCPFLAPMPHRGKRNEPAYVTLVAEKIASLRGISVLELAQHTTQNAAGLFNFSM